MRSLSLADALEEYRRATRAVDVAAVWRPHPGPQTAFVRSTAYEVLYGGAAGGGKTDALLYGPLDQIHIPACRVLFLRRTFRELREVMDRALASFPKLGATWRESEKRWTFPSGATYEFGYCIGAEEEVRMGDGSLRRMRDVRAGDSVMTLEGPRRVLRHWYAGRRPSVAVRVLGEECIVSDSHALLHWSGRWLTPYEVAVLGGCAGNDRTEPSPSTLGTSRRREWCARLMLHIPEPPSAAVMAGGNAPAYASGREPIPSAPQGSPADCHPGLHCGDAPARRRAVADPASILPQDGADRRGPMLWRPDDPESIPECSPLAGASYFHPYTMERRIASEAVQSFHARMVPAGEQALWDMTVEEVNHYITKSGLIHKNCESYSDVFQYQGQEYTEICYDELGQCPEERVWTYLVSRNRATVAGLRRRMRASANPGGPGHVWLKRRFVDHVALGDRVRGAAGELDRDFIPARLSDNPTLDLGDPLYRQRLELLPEITRRQLLEGDWTAGEGAALSELSRGAHIVDPFDVPSWWYQWGALDWGFNHPFVACRFAMDDDGNAYLVDSVHGRRLLPHEIAGRIRESMPVDQLRKFVAGHDCWAEVKARGEWTPTIAEQMSKEGIMLQKANISRVAGLNNMRAYLTHGPERPPRFRIMDTPGNRRVFETLESMVADPDHPEDALKVDANEYGEGGDDAYDAVRYGLAARPIAMREPDTTEHRAFSPEALKADAERVYKPLAHRAAKRAKTKTYGRGNTDPWS